MKYSKTFYSTITVFSVILLYISCERKKELSLHQLASDTHFKAEFSDMGYALDSLPMGVYVVYNETSMFCSNFKYEYKEGLYSLTDSKEISNPDFENKNINIYAYTPYQNMENPSIEKHHVVVETNQQNQANYNASDFMYAWVEHKALGEKIDLAFKVKFAKVVINIKNKALKESNNDIGVEIINVATSANINLKTGILSALGDIGTIKTMKQDVPNSDFNYTVQAIMIPQEIPANQTILNIEIEGHVYSYQTKHEIFIQPSTQYIYNVTIDEFGISVEFENFLRTRDGVADNLNPVSNHIYKVGDYYPMADDKMSAIGVVIEVFDNGSHGKIISLDEALDLSWGPSRLTGAKSKISGANNKEIIERQGGSVSEYEALNWCRSKGKGWYLPAINELVTIYKQKDVLNRSLSPLLRSNNLGDGVYVSSTENDDSNALVLYFGNGQRFQQDKSLTSHVRAVYDF